MIFKCFLIICMYVCSYRMKCNCLLISLFHWMQYFSRCRLSWASMPEKVTTAFIMVEWEYDCVSLDWGKTWKCSQTHHSLIKMQPWRTQCSHQSNNNNRYYLNWAIQRWNVPGWLAFTGRDKRFSNFNPASGHVLWTRTFQHTYPSLSSLQEECCH